MAHSGAAVGHGALTRAPAQKLTPDQLLSLCQTNIPAWAGFPLSEFDVNSLAEGLTNELHKVTLKGAEDKRIMPRSVLFRVFGAEIGSFYNPDLEHSVFCMFSRQGFGPMLFGQGEGWRIEEWHEAKPILVQELQWPSVLAEIAAMMARMHKLHRNPVFPAETVFPRRSATQVRLRQWADNCGQCKFTRESQWQRVADLRLEELLQDAREWLPGFLTPNRTPPPATGHDLVFCHNDVQENNLLRTTYGIRVIDYEYAHFNDQAAEIANFFCEMSLDYCVEEPPFFRHTESAFPTRRQQRLFVSVYLSEYLGQPVYPDDDALIEPFLATCDKFVAASHLLWGMWSLIRAVNADEFAFDFVGYSETRFRMYRETKRELLPQRPASNGKRGSCVNRGLLCCGAAAGAALAGGLYALVHGHPGSS
eukprot:Hpha_TRINITY_DN10487_c0_g1::TRINITY_DN10487_c0_g1_i1::g.193429::m.193429/K14156/CHK; choline/ethanolamine kinase